jgi:MFS superfamily sulfate permease-like transporter
MSIAEQPRSPRRGVRQCDLEKTLEDQNPNVVIDARAIPEIDVAAAEKLRTFVKRLRERGISVVIAKAHLPLHEAAFRLGMQDALSEENYFPQLSEAVRAYEQQKASPG